MKSATYLPEGYKEIYKIDLKKDIKAAINVNMIALILIFAMGVPMHIYKPISVVFNMDNGFVDYLVKWFIILLLYVAYMVLHELVHGIAMKICGTKNVKYGFTGMYAYAGSNDYYAKKPYIFIALAPVVLWGVVLAAINPFLDGFWFWVVYFIQIGNVSGAAGDLFVTFKFSRLPKDILVKDYGVGMTVYSKQDPVKDQYAN